MVGNINSGQVNPKGSTHSMINPTKSKRAGSEDNVNVQMKMS